ncbi:uncharacterized protein LOC123520781 [Portunus trituberculatus]|uniref:uncharacterized protein LOC123520781 n=1 Tax=Portunus trituberculatus TaxID=210409 RepID=UPI001E1D04DE|nr:uncharacterized protein LOC123520781 [Portunus trituberculatus]
MQRVETTFDHAEGCSVLYLCLPPNHFHKRCVKPNTYMMYLKLDGFVISVCIVYTLMADGCAARYGTLPLLLSPSAHDDLALEASVYKYLSKARCCWRAGSHWCSIRASVPFLCPGDGKGGAAGDVSVADGTSLQIARNRRLRKNNSHLAPSFLTSGACTPGTWTWSPCLTATQLNRLERTQKKGHRDHSRLHLHHPTMPPLPPCTSPLLLTTTLPQDCSTAFATTISPLCTAAPRNPMCL